MFVSFLFICFLIFETVLNNIDFFTINLSEPSQCDADRIYKDGNSTCVCTNNGTWPNQECVSNFGSETRNGNCVPNKYIFVDCNVCLCGPDGKINKNRCSQHNCFNLKKSRRNGPLIGTCEPTRFYQFGYCQLCFCIHKYKLICNYRRNETILRLGPFKLFKCYKLILDEIHYISRSLHQRSQAFKLRKGSARKFKMMTTSILLEEPNKKSLEESMDISNQKTFVNNGDEQSFQETNYDKEENEISKTSDASENLSIEIDQKKSFTKKSDLKIEKKLSHNLTLDIPSVLNKLMSLVLRKSMVSLGSGNNCKPGSKIIDKCTNCFCLSNGKMICTKKKC